MLKPKIEIRERQSYDVIFIDMPDGSRLSIQTSLDNMVSINLSAMGDIKMLIKPVMGNEVEIHLAEIK